ncbi:MAG: 4-hydroxy-tetrahydrodipicolinate reductase [Planctomycetota bacterium]
MKGSDESVEVVIQGADGRMGRRLMALAHEDPAMRLVGAVDRAGSEAVGRDAGELAGCGSLGLAVTDRLEPGGAVVIDFSVPSATPGVAEACVAAGSPLVVGTTGLDDAAERALTQASRRIAVLSASNFSLVVNVLHALAARAAQALGEGFDIEVLEAHHRFKRDAPSGTALALARTVCDASGRSFERDVRLERHGDDVPREPHEVTVQTLRIGDHPGEHTIYFAGLGERLELKHVSTSRDSYAVGALRAAKWLAGRPAGRYSVAEALGLAEGSA